MGSVGVPAPSQVEVDFETQNWKKARENFLSRRKDPNSDNVKKFLADQITGPAVKDLVVSTKAKADNKYSPGLGGILAKIEILMKVGDLAIKSAPESVGLAWMGVRLCLHSVEDDFATFQLFSGACADIISIMISCRVYGKMYGSHEGPDDFQELHSKVVDYIPGIYADILDFSYLVKKHMSRRTGIRIVRGMFSSAKAAFEPKITGIKLSEQNMNKYANTASQRLTIYYEKVGAEKQDQSIENQENMMTDLSFIKEALDSNMKANEIFLKHIQMLEEEKKSMKKKTPFDKAKDLFDDSAKKLSPSTNSENALRKNIQRREQGTCNWIFDLDETKSWYDSPKSGLLWISGAGGFGKSIVMSAVIHEYQENFAEMEDRTVQYFFCAKGDDSTQNADRIKKHLLHHLYSLAVSEESLEGFQKANEIVSDFLQAKDEKQKKSDKSITFDEAYTSLARTLNKKVFLVIDALDEIGDRKDSHFLETLRKMLDVPDVQIKILVGSRPSADIEEELAGVTQVKIEEHNGPDIEKNVRHELGKLPSLSKAEQELACKAIVEKARGLFRCVEPAIDFLKKPFQRPLSRRLEALPDGLNNSYLQILRQTDPDYLPLLETSLTWAIIAQLKPTVAEVMDEYSRAYAEGMEGDDNNPYDDSGDTLSSEQIRTAGGSTFLEVAGGEVAVRHTTVSDFFLKAEERVVMTNGDKKEPRTICRTKTGLDQPFSLKERDGHLHMVLTMFEHLNSSLFQKRYLKEEPEEVDGDDEENGEADSPAPDERAQDEADKQNGVVEEDGDLNVAMHNKDPDTPGPNALLTNGILGEKTVESNQDGPTEILVNGEFTANGVERPEAEQNGIERNGQKQEPSQSEQPNGESGEAAEAPSGEEKEEGAEGAAEATADEPEYDPFADDENEDEEPATDPSEAGSNAGADDSRVRYEISHWPYHFQMAEKLWPSSEREGNEEWERLWDLAEQFLCKSPSVFKVWQLQYANLPDSLFWANSENVLSPMHVAAAFGLTGLTEVLIKRGESASAAMEDGRQPLYFAAGKDIQLLKLLLENGADPNSRNNYPPPFHQQLLQNPKLEDVQLFLDHGADCSILDSWDFNTMHYFSFTGTEVPVFELLLEHKGDVNVVDDVGETPLHKLVSRREVPLELLRAYIQHGAGINIDDKDSQRPLYEVSMEGNTEAVRILLEHGADINDDDKRGVTSLHIAAYNGHLETVKLLAEKGREILNKGDNHGRTPFFFACQNGHIETARFLLKHSRELGDEGVDKPQNDGRTALSKAAGRGHLEVVKLLLDQPNVSSTVNTPETDAKRTPLHRAAYNGRGEIVDVLLEAGADPTIQDSNGKTALALCNEGWSKGKKSNDWESILTKLISYDQETAAKEDDILFTAAIKGSPVVVEKLLDAKADANRKDEHGWTPIQHARQYGHIEVAVILSKRGAEIGSRPSRWVTEWERIKVSEDGNDLEFIGTDEDTLILANHPIPAGIEKFYYEVEVRDDVGENDHPFVAIGYATQPAKLDRMPGWYNAAAPSWAYHGDDGHLFANTNSSNREYGGGPYGKGDTIGCGVIFQDGVNGTIFYTRNGKCLGPAFEKNVRGRLFPAHGMAMKAATRVNFGNDLQNKSFKWTPGISGDYDLAFVTSEAPAS